MSLRDKKNPIVESQSYSLAKTSFTASIISSLMIALLAVFETVNLSKNGGPNLLMVYVPAYVAPALCFIVAAAALMFNLEALKVRKASGFLSIACGALTCGGAIPMFLRFKSLEFMLVGIGMGLCVVAIGIVTLKSIKDE